MSETRFIATEGNVRKEIDSLNLSSITDVIIGYDARESSPLISSPLHKRFKENGINVHMLIPSNTPEMCYLSKYYGNAMLITASHNPPEYNGFKFFTNGIEVSKEDFRPGKVVVGHQSRPKYLDIYSTKIKNTKIVTCFDNLHKDKVIGFLEKIGVEYINIPGIISNEPIYNDNLKDSVITNNADYGIFFDPDMDRCLIINRKGEEISPDTIAYLFIKNCGLKNTVSTIDSSLRGNKCDIGRLHVIDYIKTHNSSFGHETSNHYYFPFNMLCSDGMYAAYSVMKFNIQNNIFSIPSTTNIFTKKNIHDILLPYRKIFVSDNTIKYRIDDNKWIILRQSETEKSLIRIITSNGFKVDGVRRESKYFDEKYNDVVIASLLESDK